MEMLLTLLLIQLATTKLEANERSAVSPTTRISDHEKIEYTIQHHGGSEKADAWEPFIKVLLSYWQNNTCLQFSKRNSTYREYIDFNILGNESYSCYTDYYDYYGKKYDKAVRSGNRGKTRINVPEYSCTARDLMTEIARALGLMPDHRRPDRDIYVTIAEEARKSDWYQIQKSDTVGLPYDFESIMHRTLNDSHYSNGRIHTVKVRNRFLADKIATDAQPSFYDYKAICNAYQCDRQCRMKITCRNGGYLHDKYFSGFNFNCECKCYPGFTGKDCGKIETKTKYNKNQHRWGIYLVGKLSNCRIDLIEKFVQKAVTAEAQNFLQLRSSDAQIVGTAAAKKLAKVLRGEEQHMPYRPIGGAAVGLFANRLLTSRLETWLVTNRNPPALLESMKSNMQDALKERIKYYSDLANGYKESGLRTFGEVFADVLGAEMHGPIGFKIVKSGLETEDLIKECIQNIIFELKNMSNVIKDYYDSEFS